MSLKALRSSHRRDWQTPQYFLDLVREVGPIAFDPATTIWNPTDAERFCAPNNVVDGLEADWNYWADGGLTYCNPPYGRGLAKHWAPKMASYNGEAVYLVPARVETAWWRLLYSWCDNALFWSSPVHGSRIKFIDESTGEQADSAPFPSCVFYRGGGPFPRVFGPHGTLVPGPGWR